MQGRSKEGCEVIGRGAALAVRCVVGLVQPDMEARVAPPRPAPQRHSPFKQALFEHDIFMVN
jgi:hypothetical protein